MIRGNLDALITHSAELGTLLHCFLLELKNHGGGEQELNSLLAELKAGKRERMILMVRAMLPMYRYVDEPFNIGIDEEDFLMPAEEFLEKHCGERVKVNRDIISAGSLCNLTYRACKYRLVHFPSHMKLTLNQVRDFARYEHAGWRELILFAKTFNQNLLEGFSVVAANVVYSEKGNQFSVWRHPDSPLQSGVLISVGAQGEAVISNSDLFLIREKE